MKIVFAVATAICTATILGVLHLDKEQNVRSNYRLSLAIADFRMSWIVVPVNIGTMYQHLRQSSLVTELQNIEWILDC